MNIKLIIAALLLAFSHLAFAPPPPIGSVTPCSDLSIRNNCSDLACTIGSYFGSSVPTNVLIPSNGNTGPYLTAPNPDATKVLTYKITGVSGTWDMQRQFTLLSILVDAPQGGHTVSAQVTYDFTNDGIVDRTEVFKPFAIDATPGLQMWQATGDTNGLQSQTGQNWVINMANGAVELKLWSSTAACCDITLSVDKLSLITIPYNGHWIQPTPSNPSCAITPTAGPSTSRVAFFIDTVQDFYLRSTVEAMFATFTAANAPLTIGVVGNRIGTDAAMVTDLLKASRNPTWEIACNGFNYEDFGNLPLDQQNALLKACKSSLEGKLYYQVATFIPPNFSYNRNTYTALYNNSFQYFVPPRQYENGPFASEKASFYEFPWASQSLSSPTASFMMTQITTAMNSDGFVVVGLHPQNFATGLEPNPTAINELASLLAQVKARNYNIVPVRAIPNDVDPNADHRYRVPNCSCVAFRLDDIQNFALKTHQKAIMDLFKQFDASITVGIIGSLFGLEDPDIVGYIQDKLAQQTPCFQFEVANHGYLHETFSNFAYEEQLSRIQLTQEKISQTLGVTPKTFIPPYNAFNNNTIRALQTTGFSYMSSYTTAEPMPLDNSVIYRVPSGASTSDLLVSDHFTPVPTQQTWNSIRSQLDLMGFASVMMHPYEFTGWTGTGYNDVLNSAQLNELRSLLQLCRDHGLRFVTLRDVQKYFNPYEVYPCTGQPLETSSAATTGSTHSQGTGTQTQTQTSNTGTNTGTSTRTQTGTQTQSGTRTQSGTQTQTQSGTQSGTNTDIPTSTDSGEDPISVSSKLVLPNAIVLAILFCVVQLFL